MSFTDYSYYLLLFALLAFTLVVRKESRWLVLLLFSAFFYSVGRWSYIFILLASISIDYFCALKMEAATQTQQRKLFLTISIISNLSILVFFKYATDIYSQWSWIEVRSAPLIFQLETLALPLGISFYTLQSMGYSIDVYRRQVPAEHHFGIFALYVSFFPQLVAGPIERAKSLLPQLHQPRAISMNNIRSGMLLILFGLFKKLVIADRLFVVLEHGLQNPSSMMGWQALSFGSLVILAIYMDLSAYTDIARGSARLFGINLAINFKQPFLATSLGDYWRRWHISLSSWILNYLYRPLAMISKSSIHRTLALIFTFLILGLWHGATWPLVVMGIAHGGIIALEQVAAKSSWAWPQGRFYDGLRIFRSHCIYNLSGVLYLAPTLGVAELIYSNTFNASSFWGLGSIALGESSYKYFFCLVVGLIIVLGIDNIKKLKTKLPSAAQYPLIVLSLLVMLLLSYDNSDDFFYFGF